MTRLPGTAPVVRVGSVGAETFRGFNSLDLGTGRRRQ